MCRRTSASAAPTSTTKALARRSTVSGTTPRPTSRAGASSARRLELVRRLAGGGTLLLVGSGRSVGLDLGRAARSHDAVLGQDHALDLVDELGMLLEIGLGI